MDKLTTLILASLISLFSSSAISTPHYIVKGPTAFEGAKFEHHCKHLTYQHASTPLYFDPYFSNSYEPLESYYFPGGRKATLKKPKECKSDKMWYLDVPLNGGTDGDHDGDGINNLDELIYGFDPLSYDSVENCSVSSSDAGYIWNETMSRSPRWGWIELVNYEPYMVAGSTQTVGLLEIFNGRVAAAFSSTIKCNNSGTISVIK